MNSPVLCALFSLLVVNSQARVIIDSETAQENRCGGTIEGNSGSIIFPSPGQIVEPGELCIWTIHLQTTSTFRLNFSTFDITGDGENCEDGGVRLYSLTNLIPPDRAESYTFCNKEPPTGGSFFLSGNLVTVIYRSTQESTEAGTGFTLHFEGVAFQSIPQTHESSYSSALSGIIRQPIDGEYAPNQVSTWLVKTGDNTSQLNLHLTFPYVDLEECSTGQPEECLCDALVLYEVTSAGVVQENRRMCGLVRGLEVRNLAPNFILAFFTDHEDVSGKGSGFELVYRPPQPPPANSTECGGVVTGTSGVIEYKAKGTYNSYERCVWTVRTPFRTQIRFTMNEMGMKPGSSDLVSIHTLNASGIQQTVSFSNPAETPQSVLVDGTVAIIIFNSGAGDSSSYSGFSLTFEAEGHVDGRFSYYNDLHSHFEATGGETMKYPAGGTYQNLELSTFVLARPTEASRESMPLVRLNVTHLDLQAGPGNECKDFIKIYYIVNYRAGVLRQLLGSGFCKTGTVPLLAADTFVIVLATDESGTGSGLELEWVVERMNLHP